MGILSNIFNVGGGIGDVVGAVGNVIDELHTSDEEKAKAKLDLEALRQKPGLYQAMTNLYEAQHRSMFVAGWRPMVGWVCALAMAFNFLLLPFMTFFASMFGKGDLVPPPLDMEVMLTVLLGMLGIGGMRSFDKSRGTSQ